MENRETDISEPSTAEIEKLESEIENALEVSQKKGKLDLIVSPNTKTIAAIYIIRNKKGDRTYFTSAVPRNLVSVEEAKDQRIPEIYVDSEYLSTEQIAGNVRAFLHDHYQKIENLPITLYSSKRNFLDKKPLAEIEPLPDNTKAA